MTSTPSWRCMCAASVVIVPKDPSPSVILYSIDRCLRGERCEAYINWQKRAIFPRPELEVIFCCFAKIITLLNRYAKEFIIHDADDSDRKDSRPPCRTHCSASRRQYLGRCR